MFEGNRQVGSPFLTEKEVWEPALIEGLVTDVPVQMRKAGRSSPLDIMSNASPTLDGRWSISERVRPPGLNGLVLISIFDVNGLTIRGESLKG